jgi:MFS family permease
MYKRFGLSRIDKLGFLSLITNLAIAFVTTIWAIYLNFIFKNTSTVGFLIGFFTFIGILSSVCIVPILEKNKKTTLFSISLIILILSYFLFSIISSIYLIIVLGIFISIFSILRINSFGIILRDNSRDNSVSKNLSLIYTFFNLAWLIGPIIAGYFAQKKGFDFVFLLSSIILFISLILFYAFRIKDNRIVKKGSDLNLFKLVYNFLKQKDRAKIYFISGGISFWTTLIYIYIPIFIVTSLKSDLIVGYFLSATIIPLVLTEYFFGNLAKKIGFKKIFFTGYLILSIIAFLSFFVSNIYLILSLIVLGSFGFAMLEPTTEAYFFDIINKNQRDKFYGPYNTTIDLHGFLASIILAGILLILPFKYIFLFTAIFMFIYSLFSLTIKNIIESRR